MKADITLKPINVLKNLAVLGFIKRAKRVYITTDITTPCDTSRHEERVTKGKAIVYVLQSERGVWYTYDHLKKKLFIHNPIPVFSF